MREDINIILVGFSMLVMVAALAVYNHHGMLRELGVWAGRRSRYLVRRDRLKEQVMRGDNTHRATTALVELSRRAG